MKTIYVVVGMGRCGKSSLIRCLTGVARAATVPITLSTQRITNVSVWVRSAQEAQKTPTKVLQELNGMQGEIGLLSLRLEPRVNNLPDANAYLATLSQHFNIVRYDIAPPTMSPNERAANVRAQWGWL